MKKLIFKKYDEEFSLAYFKDEEDTYLIKCTQYPVLYRLNIETGSHKLVSPDDVTFVLDDINWTWLNIKTYFYGSDTEEDMTQRMMELFENLKGGKDEHDIESKQTNNLIIEHE